MRYIPAFLFLLTFGCASQTRDDYPSAWDSYDPEDTRPTYDEDYVHPSRMNADQLLKRAAQAEEKGRDDQARVDYHSLFRRDRWHPQGNERYQDLMLRNGLFETVWQEYLDLWQRHPERGDAFWYHLRPMLIERKDEPISSEFMPTLTDELLEGMAGYLRRGGEPDEGEWEELEEMLKDADRHPVYHIRRIEIAPEDQLPNLVKEYADRAEENPASGNAAGLYGLALARTDTDQALSALREAWVLGLSGVWLRFAMARVCEGMADEEASGRDELRQLRGWAMAAVRFHDRAAEVLPSTFERVLRDAKARLAEIERPLEGTQE